MRSGATRVVTLAVALPATAWLTSLLPASFLLGSLLGAHSTPLIAAGTFGVLFVILFFLLQRTLAMSFGMSTPFVLSALLGVLAAIIVAVVWLQTPALASIWTLGPTMQLIFGAAYRVYWMIVVYVALAFVRS
jgi:hypothetical protein